jgi:gliding motility-associated transport system permease protein
MKHFWTILSHEIRVLLVNPGTYVAAVLFLAIMGFEFTRILDTYSQAPQDASPAIEFFRFYWLPVLFMVPLLTMRCLAEERRLGTIETLLTTPVTATEVVLGKYGAAYALYLALWGGTGGFFLILRKFASDPRLLDPGPLVGGYVFIASSGLLFIALGIFASSLVRNQTVAGILCFAMLFVLIGGGYYLAGAGWLNRESLHSLRSVADYAAISRHYEDFTRGVVDVRQLLFYLSGTVLALIFSILSLEARQLQG